MSRIKTIPNIESKFDVVVGLSDHTLGDEVSTAAVALGANIYGIYVATESTSFVTLISTILSIVFGVGYWLRDYFHILIKTFF